MHLNALFAIIFNAIQLLSISFNCFLWLGIDFIHFFKCNLSCFQLLSIAIYDLELIFSAFFKSQSNKIDQKKAKKAKKQKKSKKKVGHFALDYLNAWSSSSSKSQATSSNLK